MRQYYLILVTLVCLWIPINADEASTLTTLNELQASKKILNDEIKNKTLKRNSTKIEDEKTELNNEIKTLNEQIDDIDTKFEKIATGIDIDAVKLSDTQAHTTLSEDFQLLLRPLVESAKETTKDIRQKAKLQEEIAYYKSVLPKAEQARANVEALLKVTKDKELNKELQALEKHWEQQKTLLASKLNASIHQVTTIEKNAVSISSSIKENTKSFFHERGLFLLEGFVAFILVLAMMKLIYLLTIKLFPIFTRPKRSFYLRLLDLLFRLLTIVLSIVIPMAIFYIEEDWFLFSLGILLLFGMVWTFRNLISKLWQQARLFLNAGSVREGERIIYEGLPWKVNNINIFTTIQNPVSGLRLRIPIEKLVGLNSRPYGEHEPWFPCKLQDWVLLSDKYYGRVVGISLEFIELEDLGGGSKSYLVSDFLALAPVNISLDFRLVVTFGIGYRHQKESTVKIPELLEAFINKKLEEEDYAHGLKKLLVQFHSAGDSSLNLLIIANFDGIMATLYFRLQRAINQWCVDACNEYGWEIPFPQLTIHQPLPEVQDKAL